MTAASLSQATLRALTAELQDDLQALGKLLERLHALRSALPADEIPDPTVVMAAAGYLHHCYTAAESMHERIATTMDGWSASGHRWHQELLGRMGVELKGMRNAVLSGETRAQLARLLRFRHFFRHAYRIDLLWLEVKVLVDDVQPVMARYVEEMRTFCATLEDSAANDASQG